MPGIDVGHQFYSRAEMVSVGFHGHWLNGIDYMGASYCRGVKHLSLSLYNHFDEGSIWFSFLKAYCCLCGIFNILFYVV